ncbi:glycosyltransferase family 4 protein [Actinomycetospora soli]|uniref:glycosyltransferase family 4 protein n=1 Tax=Actinomycetospora soli TaxID=2893887 RepID=UPI001E44B07E|nr:glycosyltransferase [Actinomycetospora soli]MCD2187708.1 glycosyltransferase [Actinomycetospora soli]
MSATGSSTAAWIGPLPPPVHGASLVTARLLERVRERIDDVRVVDVAGKGAGLGHVVSRARAHLRALGVVLGLPAGAVVYVSLFGGFGLWYQLPVLALARARGLRLVAHHHSYAYITARAVPMVLITALLGRRDRHLFLSASMRSAFLDRYASRADHRVVSNAHVVDPGPVRPVAARHGLALVHVSNLSVSKGSVAAVATCAALRRRGVDATLTLVGPCGDEETAAAIAAAGEAVRWLGPCSTDEVNEALDGADVFLFPSSYVNEAEPLVVLEALSRGVPVVATGRGALPELLPADWLVADPEPEGIADRVTSLRTGPSWRADAAARARALFAARCADADPVALVLEPTVREMAVLQVVPSFDVSTREAAAALAVARSYVGASDASIHTLATGTPGADWADRPTVAAPGTGPFATMRWLLRHVRGFDLVHVHVTSGTAAASAALVSRVCGRAFVLQPHGLGVPRSGRAAALDLLLTRPALRAARAVRVEDEAERARVLAVAPGAVVAVLPTTTPRPTRTASTASTAPAVPTQRASRVAGELVEG